MLNDRSETYCSFRGQQFNVCRDEYKHDLKLKITIYFSGLYQACLTVENVIHLLTKGILTGMQGSQGSDISVHSTCPSMLQ